MTTNVHLTNTKSAFSKMSNWKLRKEVFLFKIMNSEKLSSWFKKKTNYALEKNIPIEWLLKLTVFGHFCGGESVSKCRKTIERLSQNKVTTILDYSKEHGDETTYDAAVYEVLKTITEAKSNKNISFAVFKFTSIADMDVLEMISSGAASQEQHNNFEIIKARVNRLCKAAFENNVKILVDAEHSWIQKAIDNVTEEMMMKYNRDEAIVYNTVQLYRHDRLDYLKQLHKRLALNNIKTGVKLVRGAYMDIERERAFKNGYVSPIQAKKIDTDRDYDLALRYCIENIDTVAICAGTHNQASSELLADMMLKGYINEGDKRIYFAQLLGMADHISNNLGDAGYNVAKYVPYGTVKEVMPYLFRRADENKSVAGEMSRELKLRKAELQRRKSE
ncbi:MAG: proline dehydrogenase family protein [Ferruginibacter sp.]